MPNSRPAAVCDVKVLLLLCVAVWSCKLDCGGGLMAGCGGRQGAGGVQLTHACFQVVCWCWYMMQHTL